MEAEEDSRRVAVEVEVEGERVEIRLHLWRDGAELGGSRMQGLPVTIDGLSC